MYFASKKDIWFFLMFWGFLFLIFIIYIFGSEPLGLQLITYKSILGYIISGTLIGLLLWIWLKTGYKIEKDKLKVQFGPFKKTIKIEEIEHLNKVKSPFTAPALSIHRLEILYNKYEVTHISPQNEKEFIRLLIKANPYIQLDKKLTD